MPAPKLDLHPPAPNSLRETRIGEKTVEALMLKFFKQDGVLSLQQLADRMRLGGNVLEPFLESLKDRKLVDLYRPGHYDLTARGRELAAVFEKEDAYVGPAPVSFRDYYEMVLRQAERSRRVTMDEVREAFRELVIDEELLYILKEGFNSQRVMLLYGPPGNGKTTATGCLHNLLREPVLLPYAFEFNGKAVQYFDPAFHQPLEEEDGGGAKGVLRAAALREQLDRRWLVCQAPLVVVGTEFRVEHFEISYDGIYHAPPHVKANNGIFVFDDLGRQAEDPTTILNQFIFPLENQEAIVKFGGGSSFRAPYKQHLLLSTNLDKDEIIDDAFKRRLLYQVLVERPTREGFKEIFKFVARANGIEDEGVCQRYADLLLEWLERDGRLIRGCDPRNIFIMLQASLDEGETLAQKLTPELFERIYHQYPVAYAREEVAA
ncbi:MAG: hypothetical protein ACE5JJ_04655 [Nitrospinota bacterium]